MAGIRRRLKKIRKSRAPIAKKARGKIQDAANILK